MRSLFDNIKVNAHLFLFNQITTQKILAPVGFPTLNLLIWRPTRYPITPQDLLAEECLKVNLHHLQYSFFITGLCAIAGIALWILKIVVSPYFPAWSMGLCALAAVLTLICAICTIPDIKEYPYDKNKAVGPHPPGGHTGRDLGEDGVMLESFKRRPSDIQFTDHGEDYRTDAKRRSDLGREYGRRSSDQQSNRRESKVGKDYDPRGQRQAKSPSWRDDERFELKL